MSSLVAELSPLYASAFVVVLWAGLEVTRESPVDDWLFVSSGAVTGTGLDDVLTVDGFVESEDALGTSLEETL